MHVTEIYISLSEKVSANRAQVNSMHFYKSLGELFEWLFMSISYQFVKRINFHVILSHPYLDLPLLILHLHVLVVILFFMALADM